MRVRYIEIIPGYLVKRSTESQGEVRELNHLRVLVFYLTTVQQAGHPMKQGLEIKGREIRLPKLSRGLGAVAYDRIKENLRFEAAELTLNPCCKGPIFLITSDLYDLIRGGICDLTRGGICGLTQG